ncbi:hypothetical protein EKO29_05370 [Colwellia sp. Arc7-635]|uniref:hypothetical protein n=1 Tax=Colwellia sp. Arc7-635 TaxID=2497879 RepID=UPI000F8512C2|nr:hypothetical protein [Colwellia sp. Arc7-635]AZQ83522.1 hypothetical protein EKO29_05370 [Colwellia sp. Arc7-635]
MFSKIIMQCLSLSAVLVFTTACGGGGSSSVKVTPEPTPEKVHTYRGKVIDGYVSGANVWLDINGNKQHDNSEPFTVSGDAGDYTLELNDQEQSCLAYATLYVDVPVGAIDEDLGEVTEAYQMSKPPHLAPISNADLLHISPLTTVLWQQLESKLIASNQPVQSCETLKKNYNLRAELATEIDHVIRNLVDHYNISAKAIYADFIATDDTVAYQAAQGIVTGLKAAYSHKIALESQYPTATEIRVTIYQKEFYDRINDSLNAWYRNSVIFMPKSFKSQTVRLNDDLASIDLIIYDREKSDLAWNSGTLSLQKDIYTSDGGQEYICLNTETATFTENNIQYQLSNDTQGTSAADFESCDNQAFGNGRTKYYSFSYQESGIYYSAYFTIVDDLAEFDILSHWQSLSDKANDLDSAELIAHLKQLPYRFDDEVVIDVTHWHKRITDDTKSTRVQTDKYSDGSWVRKTYKADYTYTAECSSDGVSWQGCTG